MKTTFSDQGEGKHEGLLRGVLSEELMGQHRRCFSAILKLGQVPELRGCHKHAIFSAIQSVVYGGMPVGKLLLVYYWQKKKWRVSTEKLFIAIRQSNFMSNKSN